PRWREDFAALERSLLLQIQFVRAESRWLRGRLALALAERGGTRPEALREAARMAAQLAREGRWYATVWGAMLRAGCARQQRDDAAAEGALRQAIAAGESAGMLLCAHASRLRLAEILGPEEGAQLRGEAQAWMEREGVRN